MAPSKLVELGKGDRATEMNEGSLSLCIVALEKRGIGIPTIEDKILQRAVAMLLEPIYEQSFHDFSFGFRPGKSAHKAV